MLETVTMTKDEYRDFQAGFETQEKRRHPRGEIEHREQCAVVAWARAMKRQEPRLWLLYAIPNGGVRSKAAAGKLKAEGVLAGMPDLCLPVPEISPSGLLHRSNALYIEMKSAKGKLSDRQKRVIHDLRAARNRVEVCRSADEAIAVIRNYLGMK
jgi:hypothetical protein